MENLRKFKRLAIIAIIFIVFWLNVSINFNGSQNRHFIQIEFGSKVYADSTVATISSTDSGPFASVYTGTAEVYNVSAISNGLCLKLKDLYHPYTQNIDLSLYPTVANYNVNFSSSLYYNYSISFSYDRVNQIISNVNSFTCSNTYYTGSYISSSSSISFIAKNVYEGGYHTSSGILTFKAPTINVASPSQNGTFSAQSGKNTLPLSGTIYDPDVGDIETVYYRIDGTAGQVGTQYGNTITSNNSNQPFPSPSQSIDVSGVSEGAHILYAWVQDDKGGKSAESSVAFKMDKTAPTVSAPVLTANSTSQITIQPNASDPVVNGVSSGLNLSTPYIYNRNGTDIGTWQSGNGIDTGLSPNTQYTYKYKTMDNVLNKSAYSAAASKYTLAQVPSVSVSNATAYTLTVSISDSNPVGTGYQIICTNTKTGTLQYVSSTGALLPSGTLSTDLSTWITQKTIKVTGLTDNTTYTFQAIAKNGDNVPTNPSATISWTTLVAPLPATNLAISNISNSSISVSWSANGNPSGMIYNLVLQDPHTGTWLSNPETTGTSYTFTGLSLNTQYNLWIRVRNTARDWATTGYQLFGQPYTLVNAPANPAWGIAGQTSLTLNWDRNGNPSNTQYRAVLTDPSTGNWLFNSDWKTDISTYAFTGLAPSTQYRGWVQAQNASGTATSWSDAGTKYTLANPPGTGNIGTITNNSISASWQANGNSGVTQYSLAAFNTGDVLIKQNAWTTNLNDTIAGLNSKTAYIVKVRARNGDNIETGWLTISSSTVTNPDIPLPPTGLTATVNSSSSITLSWNPSEDVTSYDILKSDTILKTDVTSPFTDTGLLPGTTYTYKVRANNVTGSSDSSPVSPTTLPNPPGVPSNPSASATTTSITLTWDAVADADGYKVEADGLVTEIGYVTTYTYNSLSQGTQHNYRILAYNAGGDGGWTEQLTASTLLDMPADVTAASSNNKIVVSWSGVQNASGYEVAIGGNTYTTALTSYICEGLDPSTIYTYKVRAVNAVSSSEWSEERAKTTLPDPPDVPGNITSTATNTTVSLSWDAAAGATGYDVMADGQLFTCVSGISFVQTGLAPGTEHILKVRARNAGGKSAWSNETIQSTLPTPPNVPANLTETTTVDSIAIQWSAVSEADGYEIEVDSTTPAAITVNTYEHQDLAPGSTHTYRVRSVKQEVPGDWSEMLTATTRSNDYGIPTGLNATPSDTSVTLAWNPVDGATGYEIEVDGVITGTGTDTQYIHTGLQPETRHTYRVRMQNTGVAGDWSGAVSAVTLACMPQAPDNLAAKAYDDRIAITWRPVLEASSYDVEIDGSSIQSVIGTAYNHEGLTPLSEHTYRIRSVNGNDAGSWSELLTVSTLSDMPAIPANINIIPANNSIRMSWDSVENADSYDIEIDGTNPENTADTQYLHEGLNAGSTHTYRVRAVNGAKAGEWSGLETVSALPDRPSTPGSIIVTTTGSAITVTYGSVDGAEGYDVEFDNIVIDNGNSTAFTKTGLTAGTQHSIRVRAKNTGGASDWSGETTILTLAETPGVPDGLGAVSATNSITISWNALEGASGYEIEADGTTVNAGSNMQYTDCGLMPGTQHTYRIRAVNEGSPGEWSGAITKATKLSAPANIETSILVGYISLTWDAVEGASSYDIEIDGTVAANVTGTAYSQEDVQPNQQHTYRIKAKNEVSEGGWSEEVSAEIPALVYSDNFVTGEEFEFCVAVSNISELSRTRLVITYDPDKSDVVDLYSETDEPDLSTGSIDGTNIKIVQFIPGRIVIMLDETGLAGEFTGFVDIIKFRSKINGQVDITYCLD